MKSHIDFKKEWEKTKKKLIEFSKEASEIAKKGEKEIAKITQQSKLHLDSTAINLKKEKLYYQIGKEYVKSRNPAKPTAKLQNFVEDVKKLEREQKSLKRKIKDGTGKNAQKKV
ncbi:MAG: hypothetical protein KC618_00585 [Candidatus Omnitrophica bacterium]|nr:hypothetical protein [Candidatus Omnitrophota bacterium]